MSVSSGDVGCPRDIVGVCVGQWTVGNENQCLQQQARVNVVHTVFGHRAWKRDSHATPHLESSDFSSLESITKPLHTICHDGQIW